MIKKELERGSLRTSLSRVLNIHLGMENLHSGFGSFHWSEEVWVFRSEERSKDIMQLGEE